jgi:hypothetical protein
MMIKLITRIKNFVINNINFRKKIDIIPLGRWYLEKEQIKIDKKIDYANIDNCYSNNRIN